MFASPLSCFFLSGAQRDLFASGIPILTYHSIAPRPTGVREPFLYVHPEQFERQIAALRQAGFASAPMDLLAGRIPLGNPGRNVVITFDDGCANVAKHAMPILARHGFRAIQFLVAGEIGGRNEWDARDGEVPERLMDGGMVREWLAAGHAIGSHTLTHPNLSRRSESEVREQVTGSKKRLEDLFGVRIAHFAYPHGRWNPMVRSLVREAGYETACTTAFGVNTEDSDRHLLQRIFPLTPAEFAGKAAHAVRRKIRAAFRRPRRGN